MIDFGFLSGDKLMAKNDDGYEGPILIPFSINLSLKPVSSFYINTNGLISFETQLSYSGSITNPLKVSYIAPFWTDIDNRKNGYVFHRKLSDIQEMDTISDDLNQVYNLSFVLTWAYVVTWSDVEPYVRLKEIYYRNLFQLIIATDGTNAFAIFNYRNITWPNHLVRKNLKIGFSFLPDYQCLETNFEESLFSEKKNQKMFQKIINGSNVKKNGKWIIRFNKKDNSCFFH